MFLKANSHMCVYEAPLCPNSGGQIAYYNLSSHLTLEKRLTDYKDT